MTKPLSELIAESEPDWYDSGLSVRKHSYDRMKAIAVELALACEAYAYKNAHPKIIEVAPMFRKYATDALTKARSILEGG